MHANTNAPPDWRAYIEAETPKLQRMSAAKREEWLELNLDYRFEFEEADPEGFWRWYPRYFPKSATEYAADIGRKLPKSVVKATKPKRAKRGDRDRRLYWRYSPLPLVVLNDPELSGNAVLVAAAIAHAIPLKETNVELSVDLTLSELARRAKVGSYKTAARAVGELTKPDKTSGATYLEAKALGRAGVRFRFGDRCRDF